MDYYLHNSMDIKINSMDIKINIQSQISLTSLYMIQISIISYELLLFNCFVPQMATNGTCNILKYDMSYMLNNIQ